MKKLNVIFFTLAFCFGSNIQAQDVQNVKNDLIFVGWARTPDIIFKNEMLKDYDRDISISFQTDSSGKVTQAKVSKSSGLDDLDNLALRVVLRSRLKMSNEQGIKVYQPISSVQKFDFKASRDPKFAIRPMIDVKNSDLDGESRSLNIYLEANESGKLTKAKITKSSGLSKLDDYVLNQFKETASFQPLIINGKPLPIKMTKEYYFPFNTTDEGDCGC